MGELERREQAMRALEADKVALKDKARAAELDKQSLVVKSTAAAEVF